MERVLNLKLASILALPRVVVLESASKKEVLDILIDKLAETDFVKSKADLQAGIYEREELMSTGIGLNLGIPHVRMKSIKDLVLAVALVKNGVDDYESLDSSKVKLIFMIVARDDQHAAHLKLLSHLSNNLKADEVRETLLNAENAAELYAYLGGK
ncbi:MAG: PTS sugar transporter subunit IIA [Lentisphaeria bacterium]|nr:PTS sugar transporter subunit IIA [Lentisphaeria bacterium]